MHSLASVPPILWLLCKCYRLVLRGTTRLAGSGNSSGGDNTGGNATDYHTTGRTNPSTSAGYNNRSSDYISSGKLDTGPCGLAGNHCISGESLRTGKQHKR